MLKLPIYLDNAATTPMDPAVLEGMLPYFREHFGNPSSRGHRLGWLAESAVSRARKSVANALGASEREIVFTAGASESNNLALFGAAYQYYPKGRHIITTRVEHKSVVEPLRQLEREGFRISWLPVDAEGRVSAEDIRRAIEPETILVSVMTANNELGTVNPIAEIAKICREYKVLFHTDAAQAFGKIPLSVQSLQVDLLTLSGHKIYGPKGVGALYVRRRAPRVNLKPLIFGGGQERGLRSGTSNVPGIVGLGVASELAQARLTLDAEHISGLRDRFFFGLKEALGDALKLNGPTSRRLPGHLNLRIEGISAEALMLGLKEMALSSGSACLSSEGEPSVVLHEIGLKPEEAAESFRIVFGRENTDEEVQFCIEKITKMVQRIRVLASRIPQQPEILL